MATINAMVSPLASAKYVAGALPTQFEPVVNAIANASAWQIFFTLLAAAVVYDQRTLSPLPPVFFPPVSCSRSSGMLG